MFCGHKNTPRSIAQTSTFSPANTEEIRWCPWIVPQKYASLTGTTQAVLKHITHLLPHTWGTSGCSNGQRWFYRSYIHLYFVSVKKITVKKITQVTSPYPFPGGNSVSSILLGSGIVWNVTHSCLQESSCDPGLAYHYSLSPSLQGTQNSTEPTRILHGS